MSKEESQIGLDLHQAKQKLAELITERKEVAKERDATPQWGETALHHMALTQRLDEIADEIAQVRDWYNVGLTERLHKESVLMNRLTIGIFVLSAILGVLTAIDILSRLFH